VKRALIAIGILSDLAAAAMLILGLINNGTAIFSNILFDVTLVGLWAVSIAALILGLRM
jgi:hypothetical protein